MQKVVDSNPTQANFLSGQISRQKTLGQYKYHVNSQKSAAHLSLTSVNFQIRLTCQLIKAVARMEVKQTEIVASGIWTRQL